MRKCVCFESPLRTSACVCKNQMILLDCRTRIGVLVTRTVAPCEKTISEWERSMKATDSYVRRSRDTPQERMDGWTIIPQ